MDVHGGWDVLRVSKHGIQRFFAKVCVWRSRITQKDDVEAGVLNFTSATAHAPSLDIHHETSVESVQLTEEGGHLVLWRSDWRQIFHSQVVADLAVKFLAGYIHKHHIILVGSDVIRIVVNVRPFAGRSWATSGCDYVAGLGGCRLVSLHGGLLL